MVEPASSLERGRCALGGDDEFALFKRKSSGDGGRLLPLARSDTEVGAMSSDVSTGREETREEEASCAR
jgi:hypothetical protein